MKTLSMFKLLPLVAASAALFGSPGANAMTLTLDDGIAADTITLNDSATPGVVSYNGAVGSNWYINITTGISDTTGVPRSLDLNTVDYSYGAGTLVITLTENFAYIPSDWGFIAEVGGQTAGSTDVQFSQVGGKILDVFTPNPGFINGVGTFGNTQPVGSDVRIVGTIVHGAGGGQSNFDANLQAVPIPAAALLFGSALLGMVGVGRRKVAQG
jgi:hypothetical protein